MDLFFDITLGIGLALGAGIRPFLPALLVGALATGNLGVDFGHTGYAFLESTAFLVAMAVAVIALALLERRFGADRLESGWPGAATAVFHLGLGAVLFAGALAAGGYLAHGGYLAWPGLIGGVLCAGLGLLAARSLFRRVRARLDPAARAALPVYGEGAGLAIAGVTIAAPPFGVVALALLAGLALTGSRREGRKYAGLRVLR